MFVEITKKNHKHYGKVFELADHESWYKYEFARYGYVRKPKKISVSGSGSILTSSMMVGATTGDLVRYDPYFYKPYVR